MSLQHLCFEIFTSLQRNWDITISLTYTHFKLQPLAITLWISTLTQITRTSLVLKLSPQRKGQWIKYHPCKWGILTNLPKAICICPLSLVISPDTQDSQRLLLGAPTDPRVKDNYVFQSQLGSIMRLHIFWQSHVPLPILPLLLEMPSYVIVIRGWDTILKAIIELWSLITIWVT